MRALVLGAGGAVGRVVVDEMRALGHEATPASRSRRAGWARIDLSAEHGLAQLAGLAESHDLVINASGVEDARIARTLSGAILIDVSATARYLERLRREAPAATGLVLGAGLVPGLSTVLLAALDAGPGDDLDLAIVLGGGEAHGAAAVAWTAELAGRRLHEPPEDEVVVNFRESRRLPGAFGDRRHLRADFPDHLLLGETGGYSVRSYLATDRRLSTTALALIGRLPRLRGVVEHAPHLGSDGWSITALNRRTGAAIGARGRGQSRATGVLTARMADAAGRLRLDRAATAADVVSLEDVRGIEGIFVVS